MLAYNPKFLKCQPTHENTFQHTWHQIINADFLAFKQHQSPPPRLWQAPWSRWRSNTPAWGKLYQIPLCYEGLRSLSDIYSRADPHGGPSISFSLNPDSRLRLSQEGGKGRKKTQTIWLPLLSSACVFRLATGIWMRRTAQLPEPCSETCMMSLRFHHYRLQMRLLWMGRVSSHACLAEISSCSHNVKKLLDKIKNGRERKSQKGWGSPS